MTKHGKRIRGILKNYDFSKSYSLREAIDILKQCPPVRFDQTVDVSIKLGIDPKKSDQQIRGAVFLPNGTGKTLRILVFASGNKVKEAVEAGADFMGSDDLVEKIKSGWLEFDVAVATPDMMREVGKLGKVLGPRNLMPTPKTGTVTTDVAKAISELRKGKIEFKADRAGVCNVGVGKLSFESSQIKENIEALSSALIKAKPPAAKGQYLVSFTISSTMGPGISIDTRELMAS
ncbi:ribosomal protein L1 [Chlamydia pneumoniae TW-183]|uniref:Large ribosomal subunit protein uL1 n=2 Tax=Chlamydia pneumoniae TaxID=83558 RepID=RL1_CHLPN|nr:50S ribosomal protein L1 [Chlamydia pneumoniae]Q9Z9A3.1 RecName: Full=Large ribosomal subunit protein uL1; AltName: Full=50S ribosomal protein L1 [Chlamydia pneumoniae]AAD18231.1 L1 Ribosomal Protein [Chlamydia pneumoniae CWL029]AAF38505.1 ribosomal protein L1 [Chlamydia pneumoniae AR39]AAP98011.1 ribosomal protein L1 [Chlamydia pneumoniae TW-183]CRI32574.1 50S ribosomal protein L1 [Chlamydia pneumoniae]CRI35435.1 50S ribosomal protein L1 [Chlamydia pneumoniae]